MNASAVAKNNPSLTPEERFYLILAATGRGDDAEQARLANAGKKITLSGPDYWPYASAFHEVSMTAFCELLAEVLNYSDAWQHADTLAAEAVEEEEPEVDPGENAGAGPPANGRDRSPLEQAEQLGLAFGYTLRTKAHGWSLFCKRLNIPPHLLWEPLPGFDRLRRALALAEKLAFVPEGFLRWLNTIRPAGAPELAEVPLTVERAADGLERLFRERAAWWGGEARSGP
jgi:hypothetical protein